MSEKLRALQEQMEAEQKQLELDIGGGPAEGSSGNGGRNNSYGSAAPEVKLDTGRHRVAVDNDGDGETERRSLLRKRRANKVEETSQLSIGKVGTIIGVGVTLALLLLALLFSSHSSDQFESFVPLTRQQLKQERRQDPCPDPWWIPEFCKGEDRISRRETWDKCEAFFKKYDYDVKYLNKCGIEVMEGKVPKDEKKAAEKAAEKAAAKAEKAAKKAEKSKGGRRLLW